jgi:cell wall-associated NlpC family hydrolase
MTPIAPTASKRSSGRDHWAIPLIGRRYRERAKGPDAFSCLGLLQYVWREKFGFDVPDVIDHAAPCFRATARGEVYHAPGFLVVPTPGYQEFDAVFMTSQHLPHHVGIYIEPDRRGGVLHAIVGAGVVFQRMTDLQLHGLSVLHAVRLEREK